jgi:hypothetical protein
VAGLVLDPSESMLIRGEEVVFLRDLGALGGEKVLT